MRAKMSAALSLMVVAPLGKTMMSLVLDGKKF
jgi:hypothetical protein